MPREEACDSLQIRKPASIEPGDNRMAPLTPMNVALPPSVYSWTDCGITCPARVALTESRKSGLDGSADSLAKLFRFRSR